ncbi:PH domain-containing protein [Vaginella massiliensis]|uniref:PH domain-containing protein n=1 Tax=Vaginella massiliensis TaxID=1816680 RepID=UPI001F3F8385|nr:PH domain-containing protein [Vaginella massiliensis]
MNLLDQSHLMDITTTEVEYEAKLHWISYVIPILMISIGALGILPAIIFRGFFQFVAFFLVFLFFKGILKYFRNKTTKIFLTDKLLTFQTGIFSKYISDISLQRLEGISIHQSLLGKTFNYGTINVSTGEITHHYFISNPLELRSFIIEKHKQQI